jgi:hypothetical protein
MLDLEVLAEEIAAIVKDQVDLATAPLVAANLALAARVTAAEARAVGPDEVAVRSIIDESIGALPAPRDGTSVTVADVEPLVAAAVARAVADLPPAQDGASVTIEDVRPLIAAEAERAVSALPPVNVALPVEAAVAAAVAALPPPVDGKSVTLAEVEPVIASAVAAAVAALPAPADGKSVTLADLDPVVAASVARAVAALPIAKDGIGLAGAMIDRTGSLVVTLTDGKLCELGRVEGKDGEPGLGFDDMAFEQTGERTARLKFVRGEQVKTFDLTVPAVIDRGVFKEGQEYTAGDAVTFGGSLWIAQKDTGQKPDGPDTGWRLAVKKGRDGRDLTRG